MKHLIPFVMLFLISISSKSQKFTTIHNGVERTYFLNVPKNLNQNKLMPLVFMLHGHGQEAYVMREVTNFDYYSERYNFIMVYPQAIDRCWNCGDNACHRTIDDAAFLHDLIDEIAQSYPIDKSRVYSTGYSQGGLLSYILAIEYPESFSAVAPNAAFCDIDRMHPDQAGVSIMHFHYLDDNNIRYSGDPNGLFEGVEEGIEKWVNINKCNNTPDTIYNKNNALGRRWESAKGNDVVLFNAEQGGHIWFHSPVHSEDYIIDFFLTHPMPDRHIEITSYNYDDVFMYTDTITIETAANFNISKTEYFANNTKIGETTPEQQPFVWQENINPGTYNLWVKAITENNDTILSSSPKRIHIEKPSINFNGFATSSSIEGESMNGSYAIDGKLSTRWSSGHKDNQWLCINMGDVYTLNGMNIFWEIAYSKSYEIFVSTDYINWTSVYKNTTGQGGNEYIGFDTVDAKYVCIYGYKRASVYGHSIYEVSFYGNIADSAYDFGTADTTLTGIFENVDNPTENTFLLHNNIIAALNVDSQQYILSFDGFWLDKSRFTYNNESCRKGDSLTISGKYHTVKDSADNEIIILTVESVKKIEQPQTKISKADDHLHCVWNNYSQCLEILLPHYTPLQWHVYNAKGKLIEKQKTGIIQPGVYNMQLKNNLSSGIFIYKVQTNKEVSIGKIVNTP